MKMTASIVDNCPFCGEIMMVVAVERGLFSDDGFQVRCVDNNCACRGPVARNPKRAIEKWSEGMHRTRKDGYKIFKEILQ